DLVQPSFTHHHTNGSYTHTAVRLRFKEGTLNFDIRNRKAADGFLAFLKATPEKLQAWQAQGALARKVDELDWIQGWLAHEAKRIQDPRRDEGDELAPRVVAKLKDPIAGRTGAALPAWEQRLLTPSGRRVASLVIAGLVTATSLAANLLATDAHWWDHANGTRSPEDYRVYLELGPLQLHKKEAIEREDDRTYELALEAKSATPLRAYRQSHASGRHVSEAKEAIQALYRAAEEQYAAKTSEKADAQAA